MNTPPVVPDSSNLAFVEQLYADYLRDPASVSPAWRGYFSTLGDGNPPADGVRLRPSFRPRSIFNPPLPGERDGHRAAQAAAVSQERVAQLVRAYRVRGHLMSAVDPLHRLVPYHPELKPQFYGFTKADLHRPFSCQSIKGAPVRPLRDIILLLRNTYCRSIAVQFMHIDELAVRTWLQERMEGTQNRLALTRAEQLRILTRLTDAVIFEEFIQKKFVGAKRFSLEGGESLIPLLDLAIEHAGEQGIDEIVLGMAHRGRLNVLANIVGKSPRLIFREFEDLDAELYLGRGDVKYHQGYHGNWVTATGKQVHLALCFNPSHLEFVNPVVLGRVRAKQDRLRDGRHERILSLLIHGDAAFAGEGIVQETLNLSELAGYGVGGTLHVVVNNQLGFTTSPAEGRSSTYATDVAKMLQSPVFHVNGEDPEAVAQVVRLALDFRRQFHRDVVIDMFCYRRYGHNETDEPAFTQPVLYRHIATRPSVRDGYLKHLLELGGVTRAEADEIAARRRAYLEQELARAPAEVPPAATRGGTLGQIWDSYRGGPDADVPEVDTGVPRSRLVSLLEALTHLPEDFHLHPKLKRAMEHRLQMAPGEKPLDWAAGEALALATLVADQYPVRLGGQDTARGTFSHRHAVLHDYENDHPYVPLQHVDPNQAPFDAWNSPLSEAGVLGFEYGYSIAYPEGLVLWEAQFGDFANAAQVYIDQFLASAEEKWHSLSGLVLLLPHGLEGQGPEHSSARLERFLALAADDNLQIVNPTTPAQLFHCLRRQVLRPWRKPLVMLTPKSLLRHPRATSTLDELATGRFQRVLPDEQAPAEAVRRIILCSGKIYYDLLQAREKAGRQDMALVRVEQYYPLPAAALEQALARYSGAVPVFWVQEEPANMGAAPHWRLRWGATLAGRPFEIISRPPAASPATGSSASHKLEQERLVAQAFE